MYMHVFIFNNINITMCMYVYMRAAVFANGLAECRAPLATCP